MDYAEIAKQGLGWMLFIGSLSVIFFMYKELKAANKEKVDLANMRVQDLKEARDAYATLSSSAQLTAQNTLTIVTNIQNIISNWKKI